MASLPRIGETKCNATFPKPSDLHKGMIGTIVLNSEYLFTFESKGQWINKAQGWFAAEGLSAAEKTVCIDKNGNVLSCGLDFYHAVYPVMVFRLIRTSEVV